MNEKPKPQQAHPELHGAHHGCQQQGQRHVVVRPHSGHACQPCRYEKAVHGHRTHRQVTRRPKKPVDHLRDKRSIEAIHHGESGNQSVRHALRDEHDAHRQSCSPIATPLVARVGREPLKGRKEGVKAHGDGLVCPKGTRGAKACV